MIRNTAFGWFALVLVTQSVTNAVEKEPNPAELYGQGVHAYFAGNMDLAIRALTDSIKLNDKSPEPYFFRGLALAQKDGLEAGQADFARGAELEAVNCTRSNDVSTALQRVQGVIRVEIEKQRRSAQKTALQRRKSANRARYKRMRRREKEVLIDPNRPAPKIDFPLPKVSEDAADPFSSGLALTGGKTVVAEQDTANSGVQTGTQPLDPFGEQPQKPAEKPEKPLDPFATEDPFGGMKPEKEAVAPNKPEPIAEDPFGGGAAMPEDPSKDPANDLFDGKVDRPSPVADAAGSIFGVLQKTLSGTSSKDRDPFGDSPEPSADDAPAPAKEEKPKTGSEPPVEDPFK